MLRSRSFLIAASILVICAGFFAKPLCTLVSGQGSISGLLGRSFHGTVVDTYRTKSAAAGTPCATRGECEESGVSMALVNPHFWKDWLTPPSIRVDGRPRTTFTVASFPRKMTGNDLVYWGAMRGLRPATHSELAAFARSGNTIRFNTRTENDGRQESEWIVAIGDVLNADGIGGFHDGTVAGLSPHKYHFDGCATLCTLKYDIGFTGEVTGSDDPEEFLGLAWHAGTQYLFVRK